MKLRNATTGEIIASRVRLAQSLLERMIGFLNRKQIDPQEGMLFPECSYIHTLGMKTTIDVVFLDGEYRVLHTISSVRPNRIAITHRGTNHVVELANGALDRCDVLVGDRLSLE